MEKNREIMQVQESIKVESNELESPSVGLKTKVSEPTMLLRHLLTTGSRVKSIRRAIKRGRVTEFGLLIAKRPFNNRANTSPRKGVNSRFVNAQKKKDYEAAKRRAIKESLQ